MGRVLIVDDADPTPSLTYRGNWVQQTTVIDANTNTNEYNSTVHKSGSGGDTMEFRFQGVGVSIYGTLDRPATNGLPDATFAVDNDTPVRFNASSGTIITLPDRNVISSHVLFYKSAVLAQGVSHVLRVVSNGGASFYLDYITVDTGSGIPGNNASQAELALLHTGNVIVDERDESVSYTGEWTDANTSQEYLGTSLLSPSRANGGNATFQFTGSSISVYGSTNLNAQGGGNPTKIQFTLDDGEGGATNQYSYESSSSGTDAIYHIPLFTKTGLDTGRKHTLVVSPAADGSPFFLDYFVYTGVDSSAGGNGGAGAGVGVGVIVGAAVGGVLLLLLLFCAVFFWRRKKRRQQGGASANGRKRKSADEKAEQLRYADMTAPRPFYSNPEYSNSQRSMVTSNHRVPMHPSPPPPQHQQQGHNQQPQHFHKPMLSVASSITPPLGNSNVANNNVGGGSAMGMGIGRGWSPSGSGNASIAVPGSAVSGRGSSDGRGSPRSGNESAGGVSGNAGGDFSGSNSLYPQFIVGMPNVAPPSSTSTQQPQPQQQQQQGSRALPVPLLIRSRSDHSGNGDEDGGVGGGGGGGDAVVIEQRRRTRPATSEKSRFGYTPTRTRSRHQHPPPPMSATSVTTSMTISSPTSPDLEFEEDSGIRIPPTLPPRYTED